MAELLRKRFRVTLDVEVVVDDITRETFAQDVSRYANRDEIVADPQQWQMAQREKRLLHSILANEDTRDRRVRVAAMKAVRDAFNYETDGTLAEDLAQVDDIDEAPRDILRSHARQLASADARFFQDVHADRLLCENTEHVENRFQGKVITADLEVIEETLSLLRPPEPPPAAPPKVQASPKVQAPPQPPPNRAARRAAQRSSKRSH